jgi:hypothetical protein
LRAATFGDTCCDSHPAGPVHDGVRHGCLQSFGVTSSRVLFRTAFAFRM